MCGRSFLPCLIIPVLILVGGAAGALPPPWINLDIGDPALAGSTGYDNGIGGFVVSGDGTDIWGTHDQFHYVFQRLSGSGTVIARITLFDGTQPGRKAGAMIRETLDPDSAHALMTIIGGGGGGVAFQWRQNKGSQSYSSHAQSGVALPQWVKLVRLGNEFTGYFSCDGLGWSQQGDAMHINIDKNAWIGLCVTSAEGASTPELARAVFDHVSVEPWPYAADPTPADGMVIDAILVVLHWSAGAYGQWHDIYFGTNFEDVNNNDPAVFRKRVPRKTSSELVVSLVRGTTYYWRINEVNDTHPDSPWLGDVWSFRVRGYEARNPRPPDGAQFVSTKPVLEWDSGSGAALHYLWFGTDPNFLDPYPIPWPFPVTLPAHDTNWTPEYELELDTNYYWRVDESPDGVTMYKGDVWHFRTTLPGLGSIAWEYWGGIPGTQIENLYNNFCYPGFPDASGTITLFDSGPEPFGADYSGGSEYGARCHGWLYAPATGNYTFWICTDDDGDLWLSTDEDPVNVVRIAYIAGWAPYNDFGNVGGSDNPYQRSAPIPLVAGQKYYIMGAWKEGWGGDHMQVAWQVPGYPEREVIAGNYLSPYLNPWPSDPDPPDGAILAEPIVFVRWTPGQTAVSHDLYFHTNFDYVNDCDPRAYIKRGPIPCMAVVPPPLPRGVRYYWRVVEIDSLGDKWEGPVWSFMVQPYEALDPYPHDGAFCVSADPILAWESGYQAAIHYVYLGTDFNSVCNANINSPEFKAYVGAPDSSWAPVADGGLTLELNTTYYWRIDESPDGVTIYKGDVWSFTTGRTLIEDLNCDSLVNLSDFAILANQWRKTGARLEADIHRDRNNTVDYRDLRVLIGAW